MLRHKQEAFRMRVSGIGLRGAIPGRSLVPAAQAQAARRRWAPIVQGALFAFK